MNDRFSKIEKLLKNATTTKEVKSLIKDLVDRDALKETETQISKVDSKAQDNHGIVTKRVQQLKEDLNSKSAHLNELIQDLNSKHREVEESIDKLKDKISNFKFTQP